MKRLIAIVVIVILAIVACKPNIAGQEQPGDVVPAAGAVEVQQLDTPAPQATPTPTPKPVYTPFPPGAKPYDGPDTTRLGLPVFPDGTYAVLGNSDPPLPYTGPTEEEKAKAIAVALAQPAIQGALAGKKYTVLRIGPGGIPPSVTAKIVTKEDQRRIEEEWKTKKNIGVTFRTYSDSFVHSVLLSLPDFKVLDIVSKYGNNPATKHEVELAQKIALSDPLVQAKFAGRTVRQMVPRIVGLQGPSDHFWVGLMFSLEPRGVVEVIVDMADEKVLEAARIVWE
ncbi:MAG: hypothetical protein HY671_10720 [Chloroflexi bacterium]|nr:hypothetical protein [Chloroflexota bacterium]